jgi:hypothetical protein
MLLLGADIECPGCAVCPASIIDTPIDTHNPEQRYYMQWYYNIFIHMVTD